MVHKVLCDELHINEESPVDVEEARAAPKKKQKSGDEHGSGSLFDTARCPICRHELIVRMSRQGPGFWCECKQFPE